MLTLGDGTAVLTKAGTHLESIGHGFDERHHLVWRIENRPVIDALPRVELLQLRAQMAFIEKEAGKSAAVGDVILVDGIVGQAQTHALQ